MWVKADCRVAHIFIITMEDKRIEELEREKKNREDFAVQKGDKYSFEWEVFQFYRGQLKGYIEGKLSVLENMRYNFVNKKEIEQLKKKLKEQEE